MEKLGKTGDKCRMHECTNTLARYRWCDDYCSEECFVSDGSSGGDSLLDYPENIQGIIEYLQEHNLSIHSVFLEYWDEDGIKIADVISACERLLRTGKCLSIANKVVDANAEDSWWNVITKALELQEDIK